jgi:hypothetical protein
MHLPTHTVETRSTPQKAIQEVNAMRKIKLPISTKKKKNHIRL